MQSAPRARAAALPDVPMIAEAGVTGFEISSWSGLCVPAKTPQPIIGLIQQAAVKALHLRDVRARLEALGNEVVGSTPEEFEAKFRADLAKYARIVKDARIPAQGRRDNTLNGRRLARTLMDTKAVGLSSHARLGPVALEVIRNALPAISSGVCGAARNEAATASLRG